MPDPEFIFFNGQAARLTSMTSTESPEGRRIVVIARGGRDRDQLLELLEDSGLRVRIGDEPEGPMRTSNIDIRSTGDGPQAVHRIQADLVPRGDEAETAPAPAVDDGIAGLEQRLDRIIELLTEIRDRG